MHTDAFKSLLEYQKNNTIPFATLYRPIAHTNFYAVSAMDNMSYSDHMNNFSDSGTTCAMSPDPGIQK